MMGTAECHCCASQAQFLPSPSPGIGPAEPGGGEAISVLSLILSLLLHPGYKGPSPLQPEAEMDAVRASALCRVLIQEEHRLYLFIHQIYVASALYLKSLYT